MYRSSICDKCEGPSMTTDATPLSSGSGPKKSSSAREPIGDPGGSAEHAGGQGRAAQTSAGEPRGGPGGTSIQAGGEHPRENHSGVPDRIATSPAGEPRGDPGEVRLRTDGEPTVIPDGDARPAATSPRGDAEVRSRQVGTVSRAQVDSASGGEVEAACGGENVEAPSRARGRRSPPCSSSSI